MESNADLLTELLLKLPPKSVFRFISVSKRWKNIIKDPLFLKSYSKLHRSSGDGRLLALIQRTFTLSIISRDEHFNVIPRCRDDISDRIETMLGRFGHYFNSSGGLILCSSGPTSYTVFNSATGKWVTLPPASPRDENLYSSLDGLSCEENIADLTPNYTVVRLRDREYNIIKIETFSSKTGEWAPSTLTAARNISPLYGPPVVANGVFHWLTTDRDVLIYNPNDEKHRLQLIQLPYKGVVDRSIIITYNIIARSPQDMLWYGAVEKTRLKFWKLETHTRGWDLKYDVCLEPMYRSEIGDGWRRTMKNNHILRESGSVVSWDPLVVLIMANRVWFLYNLEKESSRLIRACFPSADDCHSGSVSPFFETSFLSSYAL